MNYDIQKEDAPLLKSSFRVKGIIHFDLIWWDMYISWNFV